MLGHPQVLPQPLRAAVEDQIGHQQALGALTRYSLVNVTSDSVSVHRLVQTVVRSVLDEDVTRQWAGAAVDLVARAFPSSIDELADPDQWRRCAQLLPHALVAAEHAQEARVAEATTANLLMRAGSYLERRASTRPHVAFWSGRWPRSRKPMGPATLRLLPSSTPSAACSRPRETWPPPAMLTSAP